VVEISGINGMEIYSMLDLIRARKPLVHHITNWVSIYDCAQVTRAVGALPVMAHAHQEVREMTRIASSLVLNIGTLTPHLVEGMVLAGKEANAKGIPVVFDLVGVGATTLRTASALKILNEVRASVVKGNAGEVATLAGEEAEVRGVESVGFTGNLMNIAKNFSRRRGFTVVITGSNDFVSNGLDCYRIKNGHKLLGMVVGTGCMVASVIGAFASVEEDYAKASAAALACFGIAGELAAKRAKGPGTFKDMLYDELYNLNEEKIQKLQRITKE
jgi:hydroxyethylthiazole kinase